MTPLTHTPHKSRISFDFAYYREKILGIFFSPCCECIRMTIDMPKLLKYSDDDRPARAAYHSEIFQIVFLRNSYIDGLNCTVALEYL